MAAGYYWAASEPSGNAGKPRKKTDAELFGVDLSTLPVPVLPDRDNRPDWYNDWLGGDKIKQDFVVYYDAWPAVEIFTACQTQWRHGFDGVTGLDYAAVIAVIGLRQPRRSLQLELLEDVQALELGAMAAFNEQRKKAADKARKQS